MDTLSLDASIAITGISRSLGESWRKQSHQQDRGCRSEHP